MVFTDSCFAESMKEQVLTTMMSASSAREVISAPPCDSRPIITSLSTRFLGQPRLTKPIFLGVAATVLSSEASSRATESIFGGMQSLHFSIDFRATRRLSKHANAPPMPADAPQRKCYID